MDTTTLLWTLAATVFAGLQLFCSKIAAHEKRDSAFQGILMYGVSGAIAGAILIAHHWPGEWVVAGVFALLAGGVHSAGNYIRMESLKNIESVIYFPINKVLGPLAVVLGGVVWFHDPLSAREYIGIALSLTVPLLLISATERHRQHNLRAGLILLAQSTLLTSLSVLFEKQGLIRAPDVLYMLAASQAAGTLCSVLILSRQRGMRELVSHIGKRDVLLGTISGTIGFFATYALLQALLSGLVSIVYVIVAHYILIPIVLSVWWYGEHINMRKVFAIALSLVAISVLYSA